MKRRFAHCANRQTKCKRNWVIQSSLFSRLCNWWKQWSTIAIIPRHGITVFQYKPKTIIRFLLWLLPFTRLEYSITWSFVFHQSNDVIILKSKCVVGVTKPARRSLGIALHPSMIYTWDAMLRKDGFVQLVQTIWRLCSPTKPFHYKRI